MSDRYDYHDTRRLGRPVGRGATRRARSPEQVMRAAQALAGNGAVSDALSPAEVQPERDGPSGERRLLQIAPPALEIQLAARTFERFIAKQRTRSVRTLTAALAGQRGHLGTDWNAGTGASALRQRAQYRAGRRRVTVTGQLEDFQAIAWLDPALEDPSEVDDVDLRSVAISSGTIRSRVRVHMGRFNLLFAKADMEVSLDGHGTITLDYDHPKGSLKLVGHERGDGSGSLDWEYELEVSSSAVARAALHHAPAAEDPAAAGPEPLEDPDDPDDPDAAANQEVSDMTTSDDTTQGSPVHPGDRDNDLLAAAEDLESSGDGARGQASTVRRPRRVVRGATDSGLLDDASEPERVRVRSTAEEVPKDGFPSVPVVGPEEEEDEQVMLDASGQVIAGAVVGRRSADASEYLADAVRSYLGGVDEHGADHPVTADRLDRLRRSLELFDREA